MRPNKPQKLNGQKMLSPRIPQSSFTGAFTGATAGAVVALTGTGAEGTLTGGEGTLTGTGGLTGGVTGAVTGGVGVVTGGVGAVTGGVGAVTGTGIGTGIGATTGGVTGAFFGDALGEDDGMSTAYNGPIRTSCCSPELLLIPSLSLFTHTLPAESMATPSTFSGISPNFVARIGIMSNLRIFVTVVFSAIRLRSVPRSIS